MEYEFHYDSGHGWLKVKRAEIISLGLQDKISGYSYQDGEDVYLEEDCDASVFLDEKFARDEHYTQKEIDDGDDSRIRDYGHYSIA